MTGVQLSALIRRKTRTTTATYTDADMLVDVNAAVEELAGRIQQVRPEVFNMPSLADLVADQREYSFPSDMLNSMVSLELKFASTDDYVPAYPVRNAPYEFSLYEDGIAGAYNNNTPYYFIRRKAIYLLSGTIIAVTDGLKLVYNAFPAALSDLAGVTDLSADPSTTSHGFPREFHGLLADRVIIQYKDMNGIALNREDLTYDMKLETKLDEFSTVNLDQVVTASVPRTSGDGFDL